MAADPVGTLLVDRNTLQRECMRQLLPAERFKVVGEARSPEEAEDALAKGLRPGLILLDIPMVPDLAELARRLRAAAPGTKLVLLADEMEQHRLREAMTAGLDGFIPKNRPTEALAEALHLVMLGESVFPCAPDMLLSLLNRRGAPSGGGGDRGLAGNRRLSQREGEILQSLVRGDSNKLIAKRLGITEATVKVHLKGLLRKINAANRTQAAIWALENGYRDPGAAPDLPQRATS